MLKVGLISDTHSYLDPQVFEVFKEVYEIWHAGDIGTLELASQLKNFKPFYAVYGNIEYVAETMNVTRERVRQVLLKAMRILKTKV